MELLALLLIAALVAIVFLGVPRAPAGSQTLLSVVLWILVVVAVVWLLAQVVA